MKLRRGVMYMVYGAIIGLLVSVVWMFFIQTCAFTNCSWISLCDFLKATDSPAIWDVYYQYALLFAFSLGTIGFIVGLLKNDDEQLDGGAVTGIIAIVGCVITFLLFGFCAYCNSCL